MSEFLSYLQEKQGNMIDTLRTVVVQESPTLNKPLTDQAGSLIAQIFEDLTGGTTQVITNERYGNHIRGEWGEGRDQILLLAHFDTVWRKSDLEKIPFRMEGDKLYGPGVYDMKGGLVQGIYAIHALTVLKKRLGTKIVFLFTSDEEIGSPTSRALIEDEARKSKYVMVLEPSAGPNDALKTARKGVGLFHLEVSGRPSHAGADHQKGRSAIEELARQTVYLHGLTNYETGTTVNVGVISGGTTSNVVAASASADIDLRVTSQAEANRIVPLILGIVPQTEGVTLKMTGGMNRPPMERTGKVAMIYEIAQAIAREKLNFDLAEAATGGASDGNFTAPLAPTIDGLGTVGDGAHATHEHLLVSQMPIRSALVAHLIEELDQMNGGNDR
jgi:glutamate carboxypeptidase